MFDRLILSTRSRWFILGTIFAIIFILRLPTLFNDYYDLDELMLSIGANEILAGGKPFIDYVNQKLPAVEYYFSFVFNIFGENNLYVVHLLTIIVICLTSYYLYRSLTLLLASERAGYVAALAYGIFISAFDESFMATNHEVLLNLPVTISFYLFIKHCFTDNKRFYHPMLIGLCITLAFFIKHQGVLILIAYIVFLLTFRPFLNRNIPHRQNWLIAFQISFWALCFLLCAILLMHLGGFLHEAYEWGWKFNFAYMQYGAAPTAVVFKKWFFKQSQLMAVQFILWFLFVLFIYKFERKNEKSYFLLLLFVFSYLPIALGGIRLALHYFIQYLPPLCLIAGFQFIKWQTKFHKRSYALLFNLSLLLPMIFFTAYHCHDLYRKYYSEQPLSSGNLNYLMEREEYKNVTRWLREHSHKDDRIFVWGHCPELYYFANRRVGGRFFLPNFITLNNAKTRDFAEDIHDYRLPKEELRRYLGLLIEDFETKKPRYIIDTSPSDYNGYARDPLEKYPLLHRYLMDRYAVTTTISDMTIWQRK